MNDRWYPYNILHYKYMHTIQWNNIFIHFDTARITVRYMCYFAIKYPLKEETCGSLHIFKFNCARISCHINHTQSNASTSLNTHIFYLFSYT